MMCTNVCVCEANHSTPHHNTIRKVLVKSSIWPCPQSLAFCLTLVRIKRSPTWGHTPLTRWDLAGSHMCRWRYPPSMLLRNAFCVPLLPLVWMCVSFSRSSPLHSLAIAPLWLCPRWPHVLHRCYCLLRHLATTVCHRPMSICRLELRFRD